MLKHIKIENILFLDIETVPQHPSFNDVSQKMQKFWDKKSGYFRSENENASDAYQKAGIYAEFGKIICISIGFVTKKDNQTYFRIKSFCDNDEKKLLNNFADLLIRFCNNKPQRNLCAHNGKEFDFPYIARRMLINKITLPNILDIAGKKPWEVKLIDTMELWKFGDYKHYTSLDLLCEIFNIPTPKDDIDGSMIGRVYWEEKNLNRITAYCEKDVFAIVQLFLRYKGENLIPTENIEQVLN